MSRWYLKKVVEWINLSHRAECFNRLMEAWGFCWALPAHLKILLSPLWYHVQSSDTRSSVGTSVQNCLAQVGENDICLWKEDQGTVH